MGASAASLASLTSSRASLWADGDAASAADYLQNTEVVVWTPGRDGGRPLSFQPLPDFSNIRDDPDEFADAIDAAVAALAPRAKVAADTRIAQLGRAVLKKALESFAASGESDLSAFIALLAALPEDVSMPNPARARKVAMELSETLHAAMINDRLFGGSGQPADPGHLLTPTPPKRARISVINFVGLPSDEQRQSFVNQLQMALFAWIKANPAGDRPLGGLFVMDEAQTLVPSGRQTPCTESTLALASQARKYGLGLVFATQAPKGLHNRIPGNASTQCIGHLNSPTQIEAANALARARGSGNLEIGRLPTGQFYVSREGTGFDAVRTPLCLSHHPSSPLTPEEVIKRAQGR
jgi:hypothetical protein